jgi:hypothetical protein
MKQKMTPKRYWHNLVNHPGLHFAVYITLYLIGMALFMKSLELVIIGALSCSIFWIPVLITSWHFYDN